MILWYLLLALAFWTVAFKYKRRRMYKLAALVPGPKNEYPIIGVAHDLVGTTEVVVHPTDLEMILKTCLEKDDLHRFIQKVIGYGGIFAPETAMGVKINAQSDPTSSPFLASMTSLLNIVCARIFHLWLQPDWLFKLFPQFNEHEKCIKTLHDFTDEVIEKKRMELQEDKTSQTEVDHHLDLQDYQRKSFLDLLIKLSGGEKGYTNVELREEVMTLTIAGTDTSAVAIGFTLILLGKYPKIQDKVYEELYGVFGDSKRPLVKEDLLKLKYLERVVKESLRLFPPVPFIIRKIDKEIELPTGKRLPAGAGAVISIWGCHRNPEFWGPDAECFDPDRFLPERFDLVKPGSYLPFSNGPRNCLGYQYALMSIKTALCAILRNYKILGEPEATPIPHIRVKLDVMMKAVDGYQVCLEKRKSAA
ncbi:cytochrome P450 [Danaus plexippus plexippus]|uniref:Cytochrome P450 n=1 Tax=Danaus plexippus plexippus TaxID=278856 RepID=A0A212EGV4_DANPL|nr:cytochrome P450 [Danaus plexippus plexippus]